jgi:hypothetical protein
VHLLQNKIVAEGFALSIMEVPIGIKRKRVIQQSSGKGKKYLIFTGLFLQE